MALKNLKQDHYFIEDRIERESLRLFLEDSIGKGP